MKKMILYFLSTSILISCNNNKHNDHNHADKAPKTQADSLFQDIDKSHIVGMSKMAKLHKAQQNVRKALDSIASKGANKQQTLSAYVSELNAMIVELENADSEMQKWMPEFYRNTDTLSENKNERIKYLTTEKIKASKISEDIVNGIQKADSLLKIKL